jgi:transposase
MAAPSGGSGRVRRRYPAELRERAVRFVFETIEETGKSYGVITGVARQMGVGPASLRRWIRVAQAARNGPDTGRIRGASLQMKALERENRELRQANEILKATAQFLAKQLGDQRG